MEWSMRILVLTTLVGMAAGCAHYGWAGGGEGSPSIGVETIDVSPDAQVDAAALTRHLVASLEHRGFRAGWNQGESTMRCSIDFDEMASGVSDFSSSAIATCRIDDDVVTRRAHVQGSSSGVHSLSSRSNLRLEASQRALNLVAAEFDSRLISRAEN